MTYCGKQVLSSKGAERVLRSRLSFAGVAFYPAETYQVSNDFIPTKVSDSGKQLV